MKLPFGSTAAIVKNLTYLFIVLILVNTAFTDTVSAELSNLNKMVALKHRAAVMSMSELSKDREKAEILIKSHDVLVYSRDEGLLLEKDDLASVVDMTKEVLGKSDFLRIVEMPLTLSKRDLESDVGNSPGLVILVNYGSSGKEKRVFTRLLELSSGQTIYSTEARGVDFRAAVQKGLADLEKWLLTQAWRCRIIGLRKKEMIIDRGRLDGLREGVELIGYTLAESPRGRQESDEAMLLKYGTKVGTYTVVEAKNNYAKVRATDGNKLLGEGDMLEMPEVRLADRDIKTRGSRMWDKIYEK